jgi:hypothetical protein
MNDATHQDQYQLDPNQNSENFTYVPITLTEFLVLSVRTPKASLG